MAELRFNEKDIEIMSYEVEYEDVFHLKNLYARFYEWIKEEGYNSTDGGEAEQLYLEIKQPSGGTFHHIWWRFYKDMHKFLRIFLKVDFQTINMQQVEVMWKDQKTKTNKGDFVLRIGVWVQWDPDNEIGGHWFFKHFETFMRNNLYAKEIRGIRDAAEGDGNDVREWIKQFLQIKGTDNRQKSFHTENKGLGD